MSTPAIIAIFYAVGVASQIIYGIYVMDMLPRSRPHGARLILASPIWPAVLILAAVRGLFALIRTADIKIGRNRQ